MCLRYRISHSHYLGGPAEWTPQDRALAEAYDEWKQGFCPDCNTREEWWDPDRGGHRFMLIGTTRRCLGCQVKEQERKGIPKDEEGIHVELVQNPQLEPDGKGGWREKQEVVDRG